MPAPAHRRALATLAGVTAAVAAIALLAAWHPWNRPPVTDAAGAGARTEGAASGTAEDTARVPAPLTLPAGARVLVFGDSWTYGSAATDPADGYAYVLGRTQGWEVTVDGVRGSGYLRPGRDGPDFGTRITALDPGLNPDLIVVQGSINDRTQGAAGYRDAVTGAWDALAATYPHAQIVVLGPAPHVLPAGKGTIRIDRDLRALAAARGWWYISPLAEGWITDANYLQVIDTGPGNNHPSTAGHAYLAERLAAALREREATTLAAEAP